MSKIRLTGSNSGYVEIDSAADAGNLTLTLPTAGTALLSNAGNVFSGITTTGQLDINGSIDVSSTSVFNDDLTLTGASYNVVWDKSDNQLEFADNAKASFGGSLQIYRDGTNTRIQNSTNTLRIIGDSIKLNNGNVSKNFLVAENDAVQLMYNNSTKFVTTNTGAVVTGICTATSFSGSGANLTGLVTPLSNRNLLINGAMQVNQRGGLTVSNSNASRQYGGPDRFHQYYYTSGEEARYQFNQNGFNDSPYEQGFTNVAHIDVTTADTSIHADHAIWTSQRVEAYNASHLKYGHSDAVSVTLSFWIKSTITGTYSICYGHTNMDERYITTYTVNVANTWEKKTITIPGDTRSGKNITPSNGYGLEVKWVWMSGTNRVATPNTWATQGNKYGASGVTLANIFSSTSNNLYLTGCQLEVGTTATEFEHRSYGEELIRCKRYFNMVADGADRRTGSSRSEGVIGNGFFWQSTRMMVPVKFQVAMRTPNWSLYKKTGEYRYYANGQSNQTCTQNDIGLNGQDGSNSAHLNITNISSSSAAGLFFVHDINAALGFDAEL